MLPQRRRLGQAVTNYLIVTIGIITLVPGTFRWPSAWRLTGFVTVSDLVQNVALFVPLGFALAFSGGRALLVGAAISLVVEVTQVFIPGRFPSPVDFATNTAGAGLGAVVYQAISSQLGRASQGAGIKALDLPLMGTVYLVVPLVWLVGLSWPADPGRLVLVSLPLLAGAIVLASVSRHHLEARGVRRWVGAAAAGGWAAVALLPGWHQAPWWIAVVSVGVAAATAAMAFLVAAQEPLGRRFEGATVRRAVLPLAVFVLLAAAWPLGDLAVGGGWSLGWSSDSGAQSRHTILQILELMSGSVVIGYGIAEARSRAVEPIERTRWILALFSLGISVGVEAVRSSQSPYGASLVEGALLADATMFGGNLYWRQREYVLALLGRVPVGPSGRAPVPDSYGRMAPPEPAAEGAPK